MGKSQHREMKLLYGDHWDSDMDPNVHNIRTKNVGVTHHCPIEKARPKLSCYLDLHFAFCTALIEIKGKAEICGERYCPKSPNGCGTHTYKNGFNTIVKDQWKNTKSITEAFEELELAEKSQQLALDSMEPVCKPDLTYEQYNELNKQKELDAKRDRHVAMTNSRAEINTKCNARTGTKMGTRFGTKFGGKVGTKAVKNSNVQDY
ncbi:hypothetical protein P171DRAFT_479961 [Karstenula rhodostoma CBS 690.94]|uniref:Uncharacterized protein n=1 Tax=Karstenula rhodostoma CBS 690.94 TaxID=1392251 RepID=A0A9P4UGB0_9PLEO|nr:hypothetical protein P171DRAFT_479961 [Karstenula rhodostoma CBS 690.94]